jgi:hypothetical protein
MERDDLRQVMERLEAVAALSTLFNNLWYEKIRDQIQGEKVRAYLMVYEDALPLMNHLIAYTHHTSALLAEGKLDQDKYERLQMAFGQLGAALLGKEVDAGVEMPGLGELESAVDISPEQELEMEDELFESADMRVESPTWPDPGVSQGGVDELVADNGAAAGIDSLFESSGGQAVPAASQEEIDALLQEPDGGAEADDLDDLLAEETEDQPAEAAEAEEIELESAEVEAEDGTEEDLTDLLDSMAEEGEAQEQEEEVEEETDLDLGDLDLGEEKAEEEAGEEQEAELEEEPAGDAALDLEAKTGAEDLDLEDLDLGEKKAEEEDLDLSNLLDEGDQTAQEVSDDDLAALLNGEEEEEEPPKPAPKAAAPAPQAPAKPAPKAPAKPAPAKPAPKAAAPAPKAPAKPAPKAAAAKKDKAEEDSISQDEIDALFG